MAERRRLLIHASRLPPPGGHCCFHLIDQEARYLRKVLRLKPGAQVDVVDGIGHLWTAVLITGDQLELTTDRAQPLETGSKPMPQLGLAMALVRRGMDDVMRMACESWAWIMSSPSRRIAVFRKQSIVLSAGA